MTAERRVAIVTGISKGFGAAVAEDLVKDGWIVVGDGRDSASLRAVSETLARWGEVHGIQGDLTSESHLEELVAAARDAGRLELLVNNAGGLGPSPMPRLSHLRAVDLLDLFRINVVVPLALIQQCLDDLTANHGSIINISSDAAVEDYEGWGAYSITKASLEKLSAIWSVEEPEVRLFWLDPGDMRTAMHQAAFPGEDISDRPLPDASAPAVGILATGDFASGRYRAVDVVKTSQV